MLNGGCELTTSLRHPIFLEKGHDDNGSENRRYLDTCLRPLPFGRMWAILRSKTTPSALALTIRILTVTWAG